MRDIYESITGKSSQGVEARVMAKEISAHIRDTVPVSHVVGMDQPLVTRGNEYVSAEHPSLHVNDDKRWWVWFSQQNQKGGFLSGDVISWRQEYHGEAWGQAVESILGSFGGVMPIAPIKPLPAPAPPKPKKVYTPKDEEIVAQATKLCVNTPEAIAAWASKGISEIDIEVLNLGWIPKFRYMDQEFKERYSPAGLIPFYGPDGKTLINMQVRLFAPGISDRYRPYRAGYGTSVFAPWNIGNDCLIVEGAIKQIIIEKNGFPVVGIPAVRNWEACGAAAMMEAKKVERFFVWLDPGVRGPHGEIVPHKKLGWVMAEAAKREVYVVHGPMKPDDFILSHGPAMFASVMDQAERLIV